MLFRICRALEPVLRVSGGDFVYLTRALRLGAGDCFEAVQEREIGVYRIAGTARDVLTADLQRVYAENNEPAKKLQLVLPLLKSDKLDYVLQKATEIGVHKFWLYAAEASPVRGGEGRLERWQKIVAAAVCQSRRNHLPEIARIELTALAGRFAALYYAHPAAEKYLPDFPDGAALVIGPEQGFSPAELNYLAVYGQAFSLGARVLRAETAAVAIAAKILY